MIIVAPLAGAWIEIIFSPAAKLIRKASLPSRERGLKLQIHYSLYHCYWSLPSRERGLKFTKEHFIFCVFVSLPSRERGLKFENENISFEDLRRSPRGSVD